MLYLPKSENRDVKTKDTLITLIAQNEAVRTAARIVGAEFFELIRRSQDKVFLFYNAILNKIEKNEDVKKEAWVPFEDYFFSINYYLNI